MSYPKSLHDDVQLNLFHPQPTLPRWAQLPVKPREAACELLAQMLTEYCVGQAHNSKQKEPNDE
jgi:hypothetical protein